MRATLDRSRPYGTCHGGNNGVHFEQDNKEFDHEGLEVVKSGVKAAGSTAEALRGPGPSAVSVTKDSAGNLTKDGNILDMEAMELADMHALATSMGLKLHPMTGKAKTLIAITEAAQPVDQLAQQLA